MSDTATLQTNQERTALSIPESAQMLGIGRSKLYELIGNGRLPARKIGRRTVILREDVLTVLRDAPAFPVKAA